MVDNDFIRLRRAPSFFSALYPLAIGPIAVWLMSLDYPRVLVLAAYDGPTPGQTGIDTLIHGGLVQLNNRGHNLIAIRNAGYLDRMGGMWDPKTSRYVVTRALPMETCEVPLELCRQEYRYLLAQCLWASKYEDTFLSFTSRERPKAIREAKRILLNHYAPDSQHKEV